MELQIVNFKQANALKELGFPQGKALFWYSERGVEYEWTTGDLKDLEATKMYSDIDAPSLELVAKWLRETKSYYICPIPEFYSWKDEIFSAWSINIHWEDNIDEYRALWNTYEEALSAGIDKAIEILKEK